MPQNENTITLIIPLNRYSVNKNFDSLLNFGVYSAVFDEAQKQRLWKASNIISDRGYLICTFLVLNNPMKKVRRRSMFRL